MSLCIQLMLRKKIFFIYFYTLKRVIHVESHADLQLNYNVIAVR